MTSNPPLRSAGYFTWTYANQACELVFVGKGPQRQREVAFEDLLGSADLQLAWPQQIHSRVVLDADRGGLHGRGDALWTDRRGLAVSVATADCVPIVIAGPDCLAAVHAGWRGLVSGVLSATLEALPAARKNLHAWIGPAIGPCCYEVGPEVAEQVTAVSGAHIETGRMPRSHLDLPTAAAEQLTRGGVEDVNTLNVCTRCAVDWLWSYRRDGSAAGRNWTFAWMR